MTDHNQFSPGRDDSLGALLRAHWDPADDGASFLESVMARTSGGATETWWDVLAHWAPVGLAAAVLLALGLALAYSRIDSQPQAWANAAGADPAVQLLASPAPVTDDLVMAVAVGDRYSGDGR